MSVPPQDFMEIAEIFGSHSTCSRRSVGALLVRDRRIISTGYNGAPAGMPHCSHTQETIGCERAVHAEVNAIAFAARNGVSTLGSTLYTTDEPCLKCAQLLINAGIIQVIFRREYRLHDGLDLLVDAGIPVTQL